MQWRSADEGAISGERTGGTARASKRRRAFALLMSLGNGSERLGQQIFIEAEPIEVDGGE